MGFGSQVVDQVVSKSNEILKQCWQRTGDSISRMYAGTGALEGKDDKVSGHGDDKEEVYEVRDSVTS